MLDYASHEFQGAMSLLWSRGFGLSIPLLGASVMILATVLDPLG